MANYHVFRLCPGDDLKKSIVHYAGINRLRGAAVMSAVGSLSAVRIRLAGAKSELNQLVEYEILSLQGTVSSGGGTHLHISVGDSDGAVVGGHLLEGCEIRTTAEIVLAELAGWNLTRVLDQNTGFDELVAVRHSG